MAPAKKITAKIKETLPMTGPQAPTLRELMHWYCMNTNTHGCRRIVVSRGRLRRLLWILLTMTAVGLIVGYCVQLVLKYYTTSVSVTVQFHKLPFPAVTICNINPYKYSAMKGHLAELDKETLHALENLYNFSESKSRERREAGSRSKYLQCFPLMKMDSRQQETALDLGTGHRRRIAANIVPGGSSMVNVQNPQDIVGFRLCDNKNQQNCTVYKFSSGVAAIQEWYKLHFMNIMAQIGEEEKRQMSYSAEELILSCFFDGVSCDARNFTAFHHPLHGNCYTFNSGEDGEIRSTSTGGSEYGLQVILNIQEADYNPYLVTSTGAKIVVHDQKEFPFIEDIGTEIETATATSIGMHFTQSQRLSKPYSNCAETGEDIPVTILYENKTYSLQVCLHSCFQAAMVEECGCAQYSLPWPDKTRFCNYKKNPNWMFCYYRVHKQFVEEELGCQEKCKEACSLKEWTLTTSLAQWPSTVSEKWMLDLLLWDQGKNGSQLNKTDLANLKVFYKDLNERQIQENPANTIVVLLSNFGGQLGLWMSCSVVCVIEIVEVFFIDTLCIILRRRWQKAKSPLEEQGHDNPACEPDDDLPTFNTALRLSRPLQSEPPRTPPPNYSTLHLKGSSAEQPPVTQ
ncbi:hypothetical protein lerEdw1_007681 [Lerista edwardsae]|nr:hypothetical protein lerEdw1_007681 [Lerista edwardsae]